MHGCESWTVKKSWAPKNWCFWTVVLEKTLESPLDRISNQSILKEIHPEYSLEGLVLKLKLHYSGHVMQRADSLEKTLCWERLRAGGEEVTEDETVRWHHWLDGHEFKETPGDSEGHGVGKSRTWLSYWTTTIDTQGWGRLKLISNICNEFLIGEKVSLKTAGSSCSASQNIRYPFKGKSRRVNY